MVRYGGEYKIDVASVVEVASTEEACSKPFLCRGQLRKCLGDRRLASPRHAIQPVHAFVVIIRFPFFDAP
jgi:hypothetical protein